MGELIKCKDYEHLSLTACNIVKEEIIKELERKEFFSIALPGGRSPQGLFSYLKDSNIPWHRIRVYFTDERCLPPSSPESNYNLIKKLLLDHIDIPEHNTFRIQGELPPEEAAIIYEDTLKNTLDIKGFDLLVLGLGQDCHIASLFPNSEALKEMKRLVLPVFNAPVSPRVTITPPVITQSKRILLLVAGREKERAFKKMTSKKTSYHDCPGKLVCDHNRALIVYEFN